jgi:hypothetical protein
VGELQAHTFYDLAGIALHTLASRKRPFAA